jgi:glycosyltransferase involved in cell wall biosynthesis
MKQLSVIVPVYNEYESLQELCDWVVRVMDEHKFTYELILINDGSTDDSWDFIRELAYKNPMLKAVSFTRNYGKSAALDMGFSMASGEVIITMDADLQDSPDEIPALYHKIINEGYDVVSGWKKVRHDPISKTLPSKFFNRVTRWISGIKLHDFNCGLKAYRYQVVKSIHIYGEMHRYIPLIAKWNGFHKIGEQIVVHRPRIYGVTKFGFERYLNGFLDLISVSFVNRYRKKPMHFFGTLGTLSFLGGFFITLYLIFHKIYGVYNGLKVREITDQPLFFLALVALIVGAQLFLTGFLAEMLISNHSKKADYNVAEKINSEG